MDVGVAVTDLRVVFKIITCVSALTFTELEMAIILLLIFLEIVKLLQICCCRSGHSALQATRRMPLWALKIALATGKNTRIWRAGLERGTFFHLRVTACREQGSHCHD